MNPPYERSTPDDATQAQLAWAAWPSDLSTPVQAFLALRARGHRVCLLESAEGPARLSRYSFLGIDPSVSVRARREGVMLTRPGRRAERFDGDVCAALRTLAPLRPRPLAKPPAPFLGGWIGWLAYEYSSVLEARVPLAKEDPWNVPYATFDLYDDVLAFDHAAQRLYFVTRCESGATGFDAAQAHLEEIAHDTLSEASAGNLGNLRLAGEWQSTCDEQDFRRGVESLRGSIAQGEIFQAVLSQRFEQRFSGDPFTLYRVLRLENPSPHMFFFEADGLTLIGSSPERLVSVRNRLVETRPIAGTRPRGDDERSDERLGDELIADPKECAEHDMLVDLARNDLGRVARISTVRVREHRVLERFARVQHLVSRVDAELASPFDALGALCATFPAGTVSGAPKVRAQELIAGLERDTRGPYAGAFGYLDAYGNLDMALTIRTFVARDGVLSVQAGAGVVFDSDPEAERRETMHKARALFDAARAAQGSAFAASGNEPTLNGGGPA